MLLTVHFPFFPFFFQIWLDRWFEILFCPLFLSVFLFWVSVHERHFFEWGSFLDHGFVRLRGWILSSSLQFREPGSGVFQLGVLNFVSKIWRFWRVRVSSKKVCLRIDICFCNVLLFFFPLLLWCFVLLIFPIEFLINGHVLRGSNWIESEHYCFRKNVWYGFKRLELNLQHFFVCISWFALLVKFWFLKLGCSVVCVLVSP